MGPQLALAVAQVTKKQLAEPAAPELLAPAKPELELAEAGPRVVLLAAPLLLVELSEMAPLVAPGRPPPTPSAMPSMGQPAQSRAQNATSAWDPKGLSLSTAH
jgi:hypothetical protein